MTAPTVLINRLILLKFRVNTSLCKNYFYSEKFAADFEFDVRLIPRQLYAFKCAPKINATDSHSSGLCFDGVKECKGSVFS